MLAVSNEQQMLPFSAREVRDLLRIWALPRKQANRPRRKLPSAQEIRQYDLSLPLFYEGAEAVYDATYEYEPARQPPREPKAVNDVPDGFPTVTIELVAKLHAGVLHRELERLFYSREVNSKLRAEILNWIFEPELREHRARNGRQRLIEAYRIPFTFDACCYYEEIDAEALRHAIHARLEDLQAGRQFTITS